MQFIELDFSNWYFRNQVQIDRGSVWQKQAQMILLSSFLQVFILLGMYNFGHTAAAQRTSTLAWKPRIFLCEISERKRASWIWIDFSQQQIAKMNDVRRFSLQLKPSNSYLLGIQLNNRQLISIFLWKIRLSFIYTLLPYSCNHFYFDINFSNRLYSKEKRRAWPLLFWI